MYLAMTYGFTKNEKIVFLELENVIKKTKRESLSVNLLKHCAYGELQDTNKARAFNRAIGGLVKKGLVDVVDGQYSMSRKDG